MGHGIGGGVRAGVEEGLGERHKGGGQDRVKVAALEGTQRQAR